MSDYPQAPGWVRERLREGIVIPAHPLALTDARKLDERRQRVLTRYYLAAGAGGVAVGVHTTQFAIREPKHGLLRPVLELAASELRSSRQEEVHAEVRSAKSEGRGDPSLLASAAAKIGIAGVCGSTRQAVEEATLARELGYHAGLLSLGALREATEEELLAHCHHVAEIIPLFGFYLQPAAGGRLLPFGFWRRFVEIPNVVAIKIAPFNRYQTLDVVRAVAESGRAGDIALYTGNDDNIVLDLLTEYVFPLASDEVQLGITGGLLGHWSCWTRRAVELLEECRYWRSQKTVPASVLGFAAHVTDANAAFFDAANGFAGCIPGIHEVLRRQGLLANIHCLDPGEILSPGQREEIDRVCRVYPHLPDDEFVAEHLDEWLRG